MADASGNEQLTHARLLGARLHIHVYVRYAAAAAIVSGTLLAERLFGVRNLDVTLLLSTAFFIAAYNSAALLLTLPHRTPERAFAARLLLLGVTYGTILLDYLCLTIVIWALGGSRSPFLAFYLLHVVVSCMLLPRRAAVTSSLLAYLLLVALVVGEWTGFIPIRSPTGIVIGSSVPGARFALAVLVVYALMFGLITWLLTGMHEALQHRERELLRRSAESGRLSDLRRDILHIAAHNLQSPVGAATLLLRNLKGGLGGPLSEMQEEWVGRSLHRLDELSEFLHDLQVLAELQTGAVEEQAGRVEIGPLINRLAAEHRDLAAERGHRLTLELPADLNPVRGIERLLREAVVNYLTNAIKYTPDGGRIVVRAANASRMVRIEVEDDGIGISEEDQERLFAEFIRLGSEALPGGASEGTGLGLSIVRKIVEFHGGRAGVRSAPGSGSIFFLELPVESE